MIKLKDEVLGKISSLAGLSNIGTGSLGKWLSYHLWRYLKDMWMGHPETCFKGGLGSVMLMTGLNSLKGLLQPKEFHDSERENRFFHYLK